MLGTIHTNTPRNIRDSCVKTKAFALSFLHIFLALDVLTSCLHCPGDAAVNQYALTHPLSCEQPETSVALSYN